jgi:signal transduction histidine kinase
MIGGIFAKLVFVGVMSMESTVLELASEQLAGESRRQLMRYLFHEVRDPLNTITMGIVALKEDRARLSEAAADVLTMVENAVTYMSETLNDVLTIGKIEGPFQVYYFSPQALPIIFSSVSPLI